MQWIELLEKKGFCQIENFLPRKQAEQLRSKIITANHIKKWNLLTTPYRPLMKVKDRISTTVIDK